MRLGSFVEFIPRLLEPLLHPFETMYIAYRYITDTLRIAAYGSMHHPSGTRRVFGVMPYLPLPFYTLWGVAEVAGLTLVPKPEEHTMLFVDLTTVPHAIAYAPSAGWINGACRDIRKTTVARAFESVAGYPLTADPTRFEGLLVEKSEVNGAHDGRIVRGPLRRVRPGYAYERLVDNTVEGGAEIEDLRVSVVGGSIPLVFRKRRPLKRRFSGVSRKIETVNPDEAFSPAERELLIRFSRALGLDFGELDVLRDRTDGRLYIVDANKTNISPPIMLPFPERLKALETIGDAFMREFFGTTSSKQ